jgi:hypothetical protein
MESDEHSSRVDQGNQRPDLPSRDIAEELHATYCPLLLQEQSKVEEA